MNGMHPYLFFSLCLNTSKALGASIYKLLNKPNRHDPIMTTMEILNQHNKWICMQNLLLLVFLLIEELG